MSLFDNMEFSLQSENYLDETFGLSAEILSADLNTDGSILDFGHGLSDGLKSQTRVSTLLGPEDSISDLFQDNYGGSLGEDWMENVDLSTFLEPDGSVPIASVEPIVKQEPIFKTEPACILKQELVPPKQKPVPQKADVKNNAFELLKSLLTGEISEKTLLAGPITITDIPPVQTTIPSSPVAEVPDVNFLSYSEDLLAGMEPFSEASETIQIDVQPDTIDNSSVIDINQLDNTSVIDISQLDLAPEISSDDIESLLSSGPSSPEDSITFQTVDTSQLDESFTSSIDSSFDKDNSTEVVIVRESKRKSKQQNSRPSPYSSDDGMYLNKKDRKKIQNKNAATRYRVKKRQEKDTIQQQENQLYEKNRELREKADSLQREITYMKELMNEIYKAKGVKREII